MTLQHVHPGGFFWNIERTERENILLRLATEAGRLAIITRTVQEAESLSERLTLSGLPVFLASDMSRSETLETFREDPVSTLVATHDFLISHGPVRVPMAVHSRVSSSVRDYSRRLEAVPSAAHVTLVSPEDAHKATSLRNFLSNDKGHDNVIDVTLQEIVDLTDGAEMAAMSPTRRRFPLRG